MIRVTIFNLFFEYTEEEKAKCVILFEITRVNRKTFESIRISRFFNRQETIKISNPNDYYQRN